jgi:putative flavoprotein involved in K+ transport
MTMRRTDVAIIGAGQAGLAMSACLTARGIEHVVLERGRVAERWRHGSWDSLRLLTPNWLSELPGLRYAGPDPHGYMTKDEYIAYLTDYAATFAAPVIGDAEVRRVTHGGAHYCVETRGGAWRVTALVVATGQCEAPCIPPVAQQLSPYFHQLHAAQYRSPQALPEGGVLIVGASASGLQIAEELHQAGRHVTLSSGSHTRLPRHYRGRDIMWWLDRLGILDDRRVDVPDLGDAHRQPSLQIVGRRAPSLDLALLRQAGVRVMGRAITACRTAVDFANDLAASTAAAEHKLARMLERIDRGIDERGIRAGAPEPHAPVLLDAPASRIDLAASGVRTVIWATGYRPRYPWLDVPVLDRRGDLVEDGGMTAAPGLYVLGLRWLRRRSSSFITGTGRDAYELAREVASFVGQRQMKVA